MPMPPTSCLRLLAMIVTAVVLTMGAARAVMPDEMLPDPNLEARARVLSRQLRCMVCQNQSIDDSDAPLARDLRLLVRERIARGDSDRQVIDFLVARYGPFVLLKPPFNSHTMLLWLLTPLALVAGGAAIALYARRRGSGEAGEGAASALTPEEQARVAELIGGSSTGDAG
jgi:cytochrome c-type biogenesis protein CcmH